MYNNVKKIISTQSRDIVERKTLNLLDLPLEVILLILKEVLNDTDKGEHKQWDCREMAVKRAGEKI